MRRKDLKYSKYHILTESKIMKTSANPKDLIDHLTSPEIDSVIKIITVRFDPLRSYLWSFSPQILILFSYSFVVLKKKLLFFKY